MCSGWSPVLSRVLRQSDDVRAMLELVAIVPSRAERAMVDAILAPTPEVVATPPAVHIVGPECRDTPLSIAEFVEALRVEQATTR